MSEQTRFAPCSAWMQWCKSGAPCCGVEPEPAQDWSSSMDSAHWTPELDPKEMTEDA